MEYSIWDLLRHNDPFYSSKTQPKIVAPPLFTPAKAPAPRVGNWGLDSRQLGHSYGGLSAEDLRERLLKPVPPPIVQKGLPPSNVPVPLPIVQKGLPPSNVPVPPPIAQNGFPPTNVPVPAPMAQPGLPPTPTLQVDGAIPTVGVAERRTPIVPEEMPMPPQPEKQGRDWGAYFTSPMFLMGANLLANSSYNPMKQNAWGAFGQGVAGGANSIAEIQKWRAEQATKDAKKNKATWNKELGGFVRDTDDGLMIRKPGDAGWTPVGDYQTPPVSAFEGTGMYAQAFNILNEYAVAKREGRVSPELQRQYELASMYLQQPKTLSTPDGVIEQPGMDVDAWMGKQNIPPQGQESPASQPSQRIVHLPKEYKEQESQFHSLNDALNNFESKLKQYGTELWPSRDKKDIKTAHTNLLMELKELKRLGVLAGPDLDLMLSMIADPTAFSEQFYGYEDYQPSIQQVRDMAIKSFNLKRKQYGLDPYSIGKPDAQKSDAELDEEIRQLERELAP